MPARGHTTGLAPDYLGKPKAGTMRVAQSREQADTTSKHAKSRGTRSGSEVRRRCKLGTGAMIPSVATAKGTAKKQGVARAASRIGMHSWWQAHTSPLERCCPPKNLRAHRKVRTLHHAQLHDHPHESWSATTATWSSAHHPVYDIYRYGPGTVINAPAGCNQKWYGYHFFWYIPLWGASVG